MKTKDKNERRSSFSLLTTINTKNGLILLPTLWREGHRRKSAAPVQHLIVDLQMCCPATVAKIPGKSPAGKFIYFLFKSQAQRQITTSTKT